MFEYLLYKEWFNGAFCLYSDIHAHLVTLIEQCMISHLLGWCLHVEKLVVCVVNLSRFWYPYVWWISR